ncbi:MAG: hypothetical protein KGN36_11390 [Acidobacteriota bacterium]|nr:hypothetical protein [Acidobacteriota bacterium]
MDLRIYYQKIREMEEKIAGDCALVVSRATGDGGKEGTLTEAPRRVAAKMVVDGTARLATVEEASGHYAALAEAQRQAEQAAAAARLQVSVISTRDLEQLKADVRKHAKG